MAFAREHKIELCAYPTNLNPGSTVHSFAYQLYKYLSFKLGFKLVQSGWWTGSSGKAPVNQKKKKRVKSLR
jgi:hypothetical protein